MEQTSEVPQSDSRQIQLLMKLLEDRGQSQDKKSVEEIVTYLSSMEKQFSSIIDELNDVKQQLSSLQDKELSSSLSYLSKKAESKVLDAKGQFETVKQNFSSFVKTSIKGLKENTVVSLGKSVELIKIKSALINIKSKLQQSTLVFDHALDIVTKVSKELHTVSSHMHNIGKIINGKPPVKIKRQRGAKGTLLKVYKMLSKTSSHVKSMISKADETINKIDNLEHAVVKIKEEKRESVHKKLTEMKKPSKQQKKPPVKSKEKVMVK